MDESTQLHNIEEKLDNIMKLLTGDPFDSAPGLVERVKMAEQEIKTLQKWDIQKYIIQIEANQKSIERLIKAEENRKVWVKGLAVGLALNLAGLGAVLSQILNLF